MSISTDDAVKKLLAWVEESEGFVREQAPAVVDEVLRWGTVSALFWVGAGLAIGAGMTAIWRYARSHCKDSEERGFVIAVYGLMMLVPSIIVAVNTLILLQIYVAPRLYLIGQLADMAKGKS